MYNWIICLILALNQHQTLYIMHAWLYIWCTTSPVLLGLLDLLEIILAIVRNSYSRRLEEKVLKNCSKQPNQILTILSGSYFFSVWKSRTAAGKAGRTISCLRMSRLDWAGPGGLCACAAGGEIAGIILTFSGYAAKVWYGSCCSFREDIVLDKVEMQLQILSIKV